MEILTNARKKLPHKTVICAVVQKLQLEFSPRYGGRATEAPSNGCYQKSIRVSPLVLLYSLM